jgi:hypothetical protein
MGKTTTPRTRADLGALSEAEEQVLAEIDTGEFVVLGDGKRPDAPDPARQVRASLIRMLLLPKDGDGLPRLHEKGLQIAGAWIRNPLDLEGCRIGCDLALLACRFDELPVFMSATLDGLYLNGSSLPGLNGSGLNVRGGVFLGGVEARREVRLLGAKLGGNLNCSGAKFFAEKKAEGTPGNAFSADGLDAAGGVFLRGLEARGEVRLLGAKLGGNLDCDGAKFFAEKDAEGTPGNAFSADGLDAAGGVFLRGLEARGEVRLLEAKLGGNLDCDGAKFFAEKDAEGTPGAAFSADRLDAAGGVVLLGVEARGEVRLLGAKLGGNLDCIGAKFFAEKNAEGTPGDAFSADGLDTAGDVFLRGLEARGVVRLLGAKLGGDLVCIGAKFEEPEGGSPRGAKRRVLNLSGARIGGALFLRSGARVVGTLDMTAAEIGAICDDRGAWPPPGGLLLDRCRYGAFTGRAPVGAEARIEWLGRMDPARWRDDFWPQPYEQCAKVLREMGHGEDARAVLIAKERLQRAARRARATPGWRRVLAVRDAVLGATVAYGRRPLQAVVWVALFLVIGTVWFRSAEANDALKPNVPVVLRSAEWVECRAGGENRAAGESRMACFLRQPKAESYPKFNAFVYSADTLLPIVSLEMQGFWIPDDRTRAGWWARTYLWVHIAVGWALSLLAVAGFSGLVKSD